MIIFFCVLSSVLFCSNFIFLSKILSNSKNIDSYKNLSSERDELLINNSKQDSIICEKNAKIRELIDINNNQYNEINDLKSILNKIKVENAVINEKNTDLIEKLKEREDYFKIKEQKEVIYNELKQQEAYILKLKDEMFLNFKNISNNVIKEQGENFKKTQRDVFTAFQDEVKNFMLKVEENSKISSSNKIAFEQQLKFLTEDITKNSNNLAREAKDLADALRGNKKIQGNWGELQLERLFEMNGWIENRDYTKQETTYSEDGNIHRPDYIINLPNNRRVVVDCKVSLNNYIEYTKSDIKDEKEKYLKNYVSDIKKHIKELSSKEYQKELKSESLDYVFMFMPIEHAYIDAVSFDSSIYNSTFENRVAIVTSSSLLPIIKAINNLWNIEKQNKNIDEIVNIATKIYDKLSNFQNDMDKVKKNLKIAFETYEEGYKKIYTGNGNVLKLAQDMKDKGLNTNKQLNFENTEFIEDNN